MNHLIADKRIREALKCLSSRYQKVMALRYGIDGEAKTLEEIGNELSVTRERIRQIEVKALNDISNNAHELLEPCFDWVSGLIESEGGIVPEPSFLDRYGKVQKGALLLILYVGDNFSRGVGNDRVHHHWYLEEDVRVQALKEIEELERYVESQNVLIAHDDITGRVAHPRFLTISKVILQSPLGGYGFSHWPEVFPKGVRDKAYIVLKKTNAPLHFIEITKRINDLGLGKRSALKQTVHNELIKDKRFVLVGRGLYGLNEWGFRKGTVREILQAILAKEQEGFTKEELIDKVLKERFVQKNTILLNLNNRKHFSRSKDGKHTLRSAT